MKKRILGVVLVCVFVVGAVIAGISCHSVNRELKQQAVSAEITLKHGVFMLAESLKDPEKNSYYIAGMAASFCNYASLDPTDGVYQKIGDVVSLLTQVDDVERIAYDARVQAATILMRLTESSETATQLELLGQLTSLLQ